MNSCVHVAACQNDCLLIKKYHSFKPSRANSPINTETYWIVNSWKILRENGFSCHPNLILISLVKPCLQTVRKGSYVEALVKHFHLLCLGCCLSLCTKHAHFHTARMCNSQLYPSQSTFCSSFTGSAPVQSKVRTSFERQALTTKQLNVSFPEDGLLPNSCVQKCLHVIVSCNVTSVPSYVPFFWLKESNGRPVLGCAMTKCLRLIWVLKL